MTSTSRLTPTTRRRLRLLRWRTRRPLAALCAGLAALLVVHQVRPPDPPTVRVVVAARDLPSGAELSARDVADRAVAVDLVPAGWATASGSDPPDLVGRRLAVAVPAGLPLAAALLVAVDAEPPPGTVVVPVRFADPGVAAVLRPGVLVDVVAAPGADGTEPERLARAATVLAHPGAGGGAEDVGGSPDGGAGTAGTSGASGAGGADGSGWSGGAGASGASGASGGSGWSATAGDDVPVLLAVTPDESVRLGGSAGSRVLGAVIVG